MSRKPGVVASCSPDGAFIATPKNAGFCEPPNNNDSNHDSNHDNNHDNNHDRPGLPNLDFNAYTWPTHTAAPPTLTLPPADLDHQRSMIPYFGEPSMGPMGDYLITPTQPVHTVWYGNQRTTGGAVGDDTRSYYMPSNSDISARPYHPGDTRYPILLPKGPVETSAGNQDTPRRFRQPVCSVCGNLPFQDRSCSPSSPARAAPESFYATFFAWQLILTPVHSVPQLPKLQCGWVGCTNPEPFTRKGDLVRHLKYQHISRRTFSCDIGTCTKVFNRPDNLNAHIQKRHAGVWLGMWFRRGTGKELRPRSWVPTTFDLWLWLLWRQFCVIIRRGRAM